MFPHFHVIISSNRWQLQNSIFVLSNSSEMNKKCALLFVIFFLHFHLASGQTTQADRIEKARKKCLDSSENQTTGGMCGCNFAALEQWDKLLNKDYRLLLTKLAPEARTALIVAQREWLKFQESELDFIYSHYGKMDGTMWQIVIADKKMELTKKRVLTLEEYIEDLEAD